MAGIVRVDVTITLHDGSTVQGHMNYLGEDQRWGATREALGKCVAPMEAMADALRAGQHWFPAPRDDEDEEA